MKILVLKILVLKILAFLSFMVFPFLSCMESSSLSSTEDSDFESTYFVRFGKTNNSIIASNEFQSMEDISEFNESSSEHELLLSENVVEDLEYELERLENDSLIRKMNRLLQQRVNQLQEKNPENKIRARIKITINDIDYRDYK